MLGVQSWAWREPEGDGRGDLPLTWGQAEEDAPLVCRALETRCHHELRVKRKLTVHCIFGTCRAITCELHRSCETGTRC